LEPVSIPDTGQSLRQSSLTKTKLKSDHSKLLRYCSHGSESRDSMFASQCSSDLFQNKIPAVPKNLGKIFNQKTRRITHNSIFADYLHLLDFDKFRRDDEIQNCTVKDQRPSVSGQHHAPSEKLLSKRAALSEVEWGPIMSPKRRTLREPRSPRGSGTINIVWS